MHPSYLDWLVRAVPTAETARTKLSELRRIETAYGDLDTLYDQDELQGVLSDLTYSTEDTRQSRPNPSRLMINGDIRNNLASYKSALARYIRFRQDVEFAAAQPIATATAEQADNPAGRENEQTFSMERDLERALRAHLDQLEPGLVLADGGTQRAVPSGRIDILARDAQGRLVVIELKAVRAPRDAVAQVLAYLGDLQAETGTTPRGILIAPDFDPRAISAARMVPALVLMRFSFQFSFEPIGLPA